MKHIKKFESKDTVVSHYKRVNGQWVDTIEKKDKPDVKVPFKSKEHADEVRRIARENAQREYEAEQIERKRLIEIEHKRIANKKVELKTEFDLVFIDFIDRGISTSILYSSDYNIKKYTYGFEIKYPLNSNIDISAKTFKKVSDDILDAESYIKYLKTKHDMNGYTEFTNMSGVYNLTIYMKIKDVE
jgi:hypothetical protein